MAKVILITGASSGIGYITAKMLAQQGNKVYGAARQIDKIKPLEKYGVIPLALDLNNSASMKKTINIIMKQSHKIDILVNNAGYASYGAVEDVSIDQAQKQFNVNLFGLAELTQLVLPSMRKQHSGELINVTSIAGKQSAGPFSAWYTASKHAVEGFSDSLREEVKPFGISVVVIEPGPVKTNWAKIAGENLKRNSSKGAYAQAANKMAKMLKYTTKSKMTAQPIKVAKIIVKAVSVKKPKPRYMVGAAGKLLVLLHAILPDRAFDYLMTR